MPQVIFLPGILMPAELRYGALLEALGNDVTPTLKDLEVYEPGSDLETYSLAREIAGITRVADKAGFERFHLYGHSGGGAVVLAYVASNPDRVLSVAVDEPATDFSAEHKEYVRSSYGLMAPLGDADLMGSFAKELLRPGVELPPPPAETPAWMANRPAGIRAFLRALDAVNVDTDRFRSFPGPVYYSYGDLSNEAWEAMAPRLAGLFPNFTAELYQGLHHLRTSHIAEPGRVADRLRELWAKADASAS